MIPVNSVHRIRVMGRELQVRSAASAESVQKVESFVNEKLAEVAASVKSADPQVVAVLTLMNLGEAYLTMVRENDLTRQECDEMLNRLLRRLDEVLV